MKLSERMRNWDRLNLPSDAESYVAEVNALEEENERLQRELNSFVRVPTFARNAFTLKWRSIFLNNGSSWPDDGIPRRQVRVSMKAFEFLWRSTDNYNEKLIDFDEYLGRVRTVIADARPMEGIVIIVDKTL